jgi:hypothetical protein
LPISDCQLPIGVEIERVRYDKSYSSRIDGFQIGNRQLEIGNLTIRQLEIEND